MGNECSVGWVSMSSLDPTEVINTWVSTWTAIFSVFTDEQLRIKDETRAEHFTKDIKRHLRDAIHKRLLAYKTSKLFGYIVVQERVDERTNLPFVQIHGIAVAPYSVYNLRTVALALFRHLQTDYPDKEFRGMVKAVNERGKALYKYLGAVECTGWHDPDYDEHHLPLRITSQAASLAATKNEKSATIPPELL